MKTGETTFFGKANEVKVEVKQSSEQTNKNGWEKVIIGGVTGILMGAAGMYAANVIGKDSPEDASSASSGHARSHEVENGLKVAEVDDSLSFGEAFAAARNAVGAGGVFHWHGNIYNTFTESEWDNMTPQEHAQFAQQVLPEVRPEEMQSHHDTHRDTAHHQRDSLGETVRKDDGKHDEEQSKKDETGGAGQHKEEGDEPEVHYLGVEQRQTEDGETINVGHMIVGEDDVALVDLDNDLVFDVIVSDLNHNDNIEDNEIVDISEHQISVTDFAMKIAQENGDLGTGQPDVAANEQDNIGEDMPDYMNDVDVLPV